MTRRLNPWYLVGAIAVASFLACTSGGNGPAPGPPPPPATAAVRKPTLAEFNQLKQGMTYEEVAALMGSPGELTSSSGPFQTYSYEGDAFLSTIVLTFTEAKLSGFTQIGLK